MKVIVLALALGTATAALPNPNMFLVEHEANTTIYSVVPHAMMTLVGALLLGIHRTAFDKSIGRLHRLNEFKKKLPKGTCCTCLDDNILVVHAHDPKDKSKADHAMCMSCLKKHQTATGGIVGDYGRCMKFCCPMCRGKFENPMVKEALSL